jgi:hypothetical protein
MRFYCRKNIYKYFREYIESILLENDKLILYDDNEKIEILDDNTSNIFISYLPNINLSNETKNIIHIFYLNTEQLTRMDMKEFIKNNINILINLRNINKNIKINIIDYSTQNIILLKELIKDIDIYYIPYQYNINEINKLKKFQQLTPNNDYSFSGTMSNYRNEIIQKIYNNNITINNINNSWYNERDMKIGQTKILLNIHFNKNYNIYESIRCDRWIFAEKIVISEDTYNNDLIDLKDFIIFLSYNELANNAINIIKNDYIYKSLIYSEKNKIKLQNIINDRKEIYNIFRNKFI